MGQKRELKEYRAWKAMKSRCYSPSSTTGRNAHYIAKGIQVCERWRNSFENFLADMGNSPSSEHSLERKDNSKNYEPDNCKWALQEEQSNNRGDFNIIITYQGKTQTLKQWSRELKIGYPTLYTRMYRSHLSFSDAIKHDPFSKLLEYRGQKKKLKEWCTELNLPFQTMIDRKSQGWEITRMFETPIKSMI